MPTTTTITPELLDQLLAGYTSPEDLTGDDGLFRRLKKAWIEQALGAELTEHLGFEKGDPAGRGTGNNRNGASTKKLVAENGEIEIAMPRDRAGTFEPHLIAKGQTRFNGFDDKILSIYARHKRARDPGPSERALRDQRLARPSAGSPTKPSTRVRAWQSRPLDPVYPVVFFDALRVKIQD